MPAIVLLCLAYRMTTALALTLNEDERTWLAAHPELRLGVDVSWPSFEFRDEQGNDHGLTAAITALVGGSLAIAATVTRKAFTNEAMLERLDRELHIERERTDKQRADDRKADADRLERIETDIRAMRDVMFEAFQRCRTD